MYELNSSHVKTVSGGNNEALAGILLLGGIFTIAAISSIASAPSAPYRRTPYCRLVETPFTEVVPVYDPYTGVHLGDQINSYVKTEQVCS